jgi:DNA mismatch repair protein MutS
MTKNPAPAASQPTPMMAQYLALKAEATDCLLFYRMGDFFELFFDDAKTAAAALDIALTARGEHDGRPIPMCGVPAHSAEAYLARLIKAGHRVALADQIETPEQAKARGGSKTLVGRAIVRVVTAGTLTEETLLDARAANWLVALGEAGGALGLAAADISTGRFEVTEIAPESLGAELARLGAAEIIVSENADHWPDGAFPRPHGDFDSARGETRLKSLFGVATLDGFGAFGRPELVAAGGLVAYLDHAGKGSLPFLQTPLRRAPTQHMMIDAATRDSLELTQAQGGGRAGSLLDTIDRTVTGAGARLLAADLGAPLAERGLIEARHDLVGFWFDDPHQREGLRAALKALPDVGRALGRLAAGRGGPRDLGQLRDGLGEARMLRERLSRLAEPPALLADLLPRLDGHGTLVDNCRGRWCPRRRSMRRKAAISPKAMTPRSTPCAGSARWAPRHRSARSGLSRRRPASRRSRSVTMACSAIMSRCRQSHADVLMAQESGFTHRQTLAGVVRFNAPELHEPRAAGDAGGRSCDRRRGRASRSADRGSARAARRDRSTCDALARHRRRRGAGRTGDEAKLVPRPSMVDHPCLESRAVGIRLSKQRSRKRRALRPNDSRCPRTSASGSSPVRTWAVNRHSCARMR